MGTCVRGSRINDGEHVVPYVRRELLMKHKVFICLVLAALMFSGSSSQAASAGDAVPRAEKYFPFGTSMS